MNRLRRFTGLAVVMATVVSLSEVAAQSSREQDPNRKAVTAVRPTGAQAQPARSPIGTIGTVPSQPFACVEPEIPETPDLRAADGRQRASRRAAVSSSAVNADRSRIEFRAPGGSTLRSKPSTSGSTATSRTSSLSVSATQAAAAGASSAGKLAPKPGESCLDQALHSFKLDGYVLPDMPPVKWPETDCNVDRECVDANRSWIRAHYYVWIARLMVDLIAAQDHSEKRAWMWGRPGINAQGQPVTEKTSFEYWFGPYTDKRFRAVKDGLEGLWDVLTHAKSGGYGIELRCPDALGAGNVCFTKKPGAHHIVRGNVDLCEAFFEDRARWDQARITAHELLHHLWVDWGDIWVAIQDHHYHGHGAACIANPDSSPQYGEDKIRHLATYLNSNGDNCGHRARNVRNNDTYAYFATWVGELVYNGSMTQWPHPAEPTPQPPNCVGDENCLCDDQETWPSNEPFEPDGDFSAGQWCDDNDGEMTCRATKFGAATRGICKRCDDVRGPGCECSNAKPCEIGSCYGDATFNGGTGHCFKDAPPSWACLADCSRLLNDNGAWCYAAYPTGEARCMDSLCSEPQAFNCNLQGKVCRYGECIVECANDAECAAKGYPGYYRCNQARCEHGF